MKTKITNTKNINENKNFYQNLKSFDSFLMMSEENSYSCVPANWLLIISDIKDSTIAIEKGKYKDVNLIGAACISAVEGIIENNNLPSIFGGDGASLLIHPDYLEQAEIELSKVRNSAKAKFGLELRISVIPVSEIEKSGFLIKIAKLKLSGYKSVAHFSGGGLNYADSLIKNSSQFEMVCRSNQLSEFNNLTCRWKPIKNTNGKILTLIINAKTFDNYQEILTKLSESIGVDPQMFNPIKLKKMRYKNLLMMIINEAKIGLMFFNIKKLIQIIFCSFSFGFFHKMSPQFMKNYFKSMPRHSDFRKFDDTLRMVIDCSDEQVDFIKKMLQQLKQDGKIHYGLNESESALMTCLVYNTSESGHIHFIDGDKGGYVEASKQLKEQIKQDLLKEFAA